MKVIKQLKYNRLDNGSFHVNNGKVVTVPDDTLSMREIYNRFRNGEPLDVNLYDPYYSNDEYQDIDVSVLDPVEVMELTQKYNEIRKKHEERYIKSQELASVSEQSQKVYDSLFVDD